MEELEKEFHRQEWKRRQLEDLKESPSVPTAQELHFWDDFVLERWDHSTELVNDY